jgi:hypothetical protein
LSALAKDAKQQGWWNSFADSIPESMNLLLTLEDEAVREDHFSCVYVPGLLQTRAYSTALQKANEVPLEPEEIERLVDIRMKRQEILTRPEAPTAVGDPRRVSDPPCRRITQTSCVSSSVGCSKCNESSSHHASGPALLRGAHAAALGSFVIIGGAEPPSTSCTSTSIRLPLPGEGRGTGPIQTCVRVLRAQALDMEASSTMIHRARKEL